MTQQEFRSKRSNLPVIPGWTQLVPDKDDSIEVELHLAEADRSKERAVILMEYWATPDTITIQSVLPAEAFVASPEGWCVFVPAQGKILIRAIDAQPRPPVLASHQITLDPDTQPGTSVTLTVQFP